MAPPARVPLPLMIPCEAETSCFMPKLQAGLLCSSRQWEWECCVEIPVSSVSPLVSHSVLGLDVKDKAGGGELEERFEV